MAYESIELDLDEDIQLHLICTTFDIKLELLEDIKSIEPNHEKRIVQLVLSEAVTRACMAAIDAEEQADKEN
jgi:hypothetical protein